MAMGTVRTSTVAALLLLGGCAGHDYGPIDTRYEAWYDYHYGPLFAGYWGRDGAFYYRTSPDGRFRRDSGGHVVRTERPGFQPVIVNGPRPDWDRQFNIHNIPA
jgi:hypothetical protein